MASISCQLLPPVAPRPVAGLPPPRGAGEGVGAGAVPPRAGEVVVVLVLPPGVVVVLPARLGVVVREALDLFMPPGKAPPMEIGRAHV